MGKLDAFTIWMTFSIIVLINQLIKLNTIYPEEFNNLKKD